MRATNEYVQLVREMKNQIEDVERLVKVLLLNDIIVDTEDVCEFNEPMDEKIRSVMNKYKFTVGKREEIEGIKIINIMIPKNVTVRINEIRLINNMLKQRYPNIKPVFNYEIMSRNHSNRLIQERISYKVKNKELHIFG